MRALLLAVVSGLLLAACFPPWDLTWCVWIWPWPILWTLKESGVSRPVSWKRAFGLGYVSGLAGWLASLAWLIEVHWAGWIALGIYLPLFTALWCLAMTRWAPLHTLRHALWAASWWALGEWLRGWLLTGFSWNQLGVALPTWPWLIQPAEWIGSVGLSVPTMFLSLTGFIALRDRSFRRPIFIGGGSLLCWSMVGYFLAIRATPVQSKDLHVGLVQPNISQADKWADEAIEAHASELPAEEVTAAQTRIRNRYLQLADLTQAALNQGPLDLVVWPESSLPYPFHLETTRQFLDTVCQDGEFTLAGGVDVIDGSRGYNCLFACHRGHGDADIYRKVHLVLFGECIPFREELPWLANAIGDLIPADLSAGTSTEPLTMLANGVQLIPLVCFEDTVPRHARKFVRAQPQVIVSVSNDAWFNISAQQEMHFANARLRTVELRRPYVRSANTGVTGAISHLGSVLGKLDKYQTGQLTLTVPVPQENEVTLYAKIGDLLPALWGGLTLLWAMRRGRAARQHF